MAMAAQHTPPGNHERGGLLSKPASHRQPLSDVERPLERQSHGVSQGPQMADKRTLAGNRRSNIRLLGHLERIVYLNPEVSHGALDFCMAQQQLDSAQIRGASID